MLLAAATTCESRSIVRSVSSCDRARAQNILVYGIALEAPLNGQSLIRACATTQGEYRYVTDSNDLTDVFHEIAVEITALRLFR